MTNIHDIVRLTGTQMTNQQLADMALQEDQEARRLIRAGEDDRAEAHRARAIALADLLS